jgi:hypothetical protein
MRHVGVVGHEASKFTRSGEAQARQIIRVLLSDPLAILVSGGCHLGGIDIWAEEIADELGRLKQIYLPKVLSWEGGFKQRNKLIAENSDELHCLAVVRLASSYRGMRFSSCYHCGSSDHVKGGGCWTMKHARKLEKLTQLHPIDNREDDQ